MSTAKWQNIAGSKKFFNLDGERILSRFKISTFWKALYLGIYSRKCEKFIWCHWTLAYLISGYVLRCLSISRDIWVISSPFMAGTSTHYFLSFHFNLKWHFGVKSILERIYVSNLISARDHPFKWQCRLIFESKFWKKIKVNNHPSGVTYGCTGKHWTVEKFFFSKFTPSFSRYRRRCQKSTSQ